MAKTTAQIIREARDKAGEITDHLDAALMQSGDDRTAVLRCTLNHAIELNMLMFDSLKTETQRDSA